MKRQRLPGRAPLMSATPPTATTKSLPTRVSATTAVPTAAAARCRGSAGAVMINVTSPGVRDWPFPTIPRAVTWTAIRSGATMDACAARMSRTSALLDRPDLDAVPTSSSGPSAVRPHRARPAAILRRVSYRALVS
jgi:hypothetical protein